MSKSSDNATSEGRDLILIITTVLGGALAPYCFLYGLKGGFDVPEKGLFILAHVAFWTLSWAGVAYMAYLSLRTAQRSRSLVSSLGIAALVLGLSSACVFYFSITLMANIRTYYHGFDFALVVIPFIMMLFLSLSTILCGRLISRRYDFPSESRRFAYFMSFVVLFWICFAASPFFALLLAGMLFWHLGLLLLALPGIVLFFAYLILSQVLASYWRSPLPNVSADRAET